MKKLIFLISLCFLAGTSIAQYEDPVTHDQKETATSLEDQLTTDPSSLPATRAYAAEAIERKKFDEKKWRDIVDSRKYADTQTHNQSNEQKRGSGQEGQNSGKRGYYEDEEDGRYDYDVEESESVNLGFLGPIFQIIFYLVIIAIIGLILTQIIRNTSFKSNPKRKITALASVSDVHDITELDTEDLIQKAHLANDYKLAIRLYFLHLLKKLNENGVIVWTKDKTNRDYLSELFAKQYYFDEVRKLTLAYERVWYGEHVPDEERYQELRNEFQQINQKFKAS
jgi:hypothetical protein